MRALSPLMRTQTELLGASPSVTGDLFIGLKQTRDPTNNDVRNTNIEPQETPAKLEGKFPHNSSLQEIFINVTLYKKLEVNCIKKTRKYSL